MRIHLYQDTDSATSSSGQTVCINARVLTNGLRGGGAGRWEVLSEVDVAHVAAAAAEVVRPILNLWGEVGHHAAVVAATLVVAQVGPATWQWEGDS